MDKKSLKSKNRASLFSDLLNPYGIKSDICFYIYHVPIGVILRNNKRKNTEPIQNDNCWTDSVFFIVLNISMESYENTGANDKYRDSGIWGINYSLNYDYRNSYWSSLVFILQYNVPHEVS